MYDNKHVCSVCLSRKYSFDDCCNCEIHFIIQPVKNSKIDMKDALPK